MGWKGRWLIGIENVPGLSKTDASQFERSKFLDNPSRFPPVPTGLPVCSGTLTLWNGRIGEIRPLIMLGLGEGFSDPFWNRGVGRDLSVDDTVDGGAGDAVSLGDLAEALPVLAIPDDGFTVESEWLASDVTAFEAGEPHAGAYCRLCWPQPPPATSITSSAIPATGSSISASRPTFSAPV